MLPHQSGRLGLPAQWYLPVAPLQIPPGSGQMHITDWLISVGMLKLQS